MERRPLPSAEHNPVARERFNQPPSIIKKYRLLYIKDMSIGHAFFSVTEHAVWNPEKRRILYGLF